LSEDNASRSIRVDKKTDDRIEDISEVTGESKKDIIAGAMAVVEYFFNNNVGFPLTYAGFAELRSLEANRRSLDSDPSATPEMKEQFDRRIAAVRAKLKSYREADDHGT